MVKTEETTIDNRKVIVVQLPARRSLALKTQLVKLLGPSLLKMFNSLGKPGAEISALDRQFDFSSAASALEALTAQVSPDAFFNLVVDCMAGTKVEHETKMWDINSSSFDVVFSGELLFMYKVLWFSLKVNYSDFFGLSGIGGLLERVSQQMPMPQESKAK